MPKDPPIGRWGFIIPAGFHGDGKTAEGGPEVCCNGCRTWFPKRYLRCPACDHARSGFNPTIRAGQLNRHLLGYAHGAKKQPAFAPVTSDVNLPSAA